MATIVGGIATSHVPAIGGAIVRGWQNEPAWKPFFDGYAPIHQWLASARPDVAVVIYNDHGLNFFLNALPTFAVGAAATYVNDDEGWGLPVVPPYPGHPELSWHLIESLVADEFDITTCQEMRVDHAFTLPLALLWPGAGMRPVRTVPIVINHVQHPLPTPARCYKLGAAIGRAIESFGDDSRVVVIGSGGLSHQLDGERAGFLNPEFDKLCLDQLVNDPVAFTRYSVADIVRLGGAQDTEFTTWLAMRAALGGRVVERHQQYHVPVSNTATAVLLLENAAMNTTSG